MPRHNVREQIVEASLDGLPGLASYTVRPNRPYFIANATQIYPDDYFDTSIQATRADRQFCIDQAGKYKTYGSNVWGLSACDKPFGGYEAYAAPPGKPIHDGTIAPWATVASIAFVPEETIAAVNYIYDRFGDRLWGRYGFVHQ